MNDNSSMFTMPVAPTGGYGYGGGMNGGGDWLWLIVLFLFSGMWGGNGYGGGMNGGVGAEVQRGFDHSATTNALNSISSGICDSTYALNNTITNGFHGVDSAVCNLGYQTQAGFNSLAAQLAQCCCDNREAISNVRFDMAKEACDTRHAITDSTRSIIDFITNDKLSTLTAENTALKTQSYISANQDAQTAELLRRLAPPTPVPAFVVANPFTPPTTGTTT